MITLRASVPTEHAAKYMTQLAKFWSHKFPELTFDETQAHIPLTRGPCDLEATDGQLVLTVSGDSEENAARLAKVVADHLKRFAFRETLDISWQAAGH